MGSGLVTVPLIGGALGWALPIVLYFLYMLAYAAPVAARERRLAAEIGVHQVLGISPAEVAAAERRVRLAKYVGLGLFSIVAIGVVAVAFMASRGNSPAIIAPPSELAELYDVRLGNDSVLHKAARVQAGFFEAVRTPPIAGRYFLAAEYGASATPAVVLSQSLWQESFNGSLAVLGQALALNGVDHVVVAIAPNTLNTPPEARLWTPRRGQP